VSPLKGWLPMVLGLLGVVLGAVWTLQGLNVLDDSVMSGVQIWSIIGPVVVVIGLVLVVVGLRIRNRAKRAELAATPPAAEQ
jgi:CDP-diglyceride synthetase